MNATAAHLETMPIDSLVPAHYNPRKSPGDLSDLIESIRKDGIQTPLFVREIHGVLEIVAGSRRFAAAQALGLKTVPCLVYDDLDSDEAFALAITDNLQRSDIHPMEEAQAYAALALADPDLKMDAEAIAKRVAKPVSYVATRLRLTGLVLPARVLFQGLHLTLDHALLLARLEPADQVRAIEFMLEIDRKYTKQPIEELVEEAIKDYAEEEKERDHIGFGRNIHDIRIVKATASQLKKWIEGNILLKLKGVPWRLDDAELVPAAGACITCPKRSGSNQALFGDLTAAEDICLDTVCFGAKQDACVKQHKEAAKAHAKVDGVAPGAGLLLKISSKRSNAKLEEPAVLGGQVETRKTIKEGQWVAAALSGKNSCDNTVKALMVDGPDKGKLIPVCADQKCKVHAHTTHTPYTNSMQQPKPVDPKKAAEEQAWVAAFLKDESHIRSLMYKNVLEFAPINMGTILRYFITERIEHSYDMDIECLAVCGWLAIAVPEVTGKEAWPGDNARNREEDAQKRLMALIAKAPMDQLWIIAFHVIAIDATMVTGREIGDKDKGRAAMYRVAKMFGKEDLVRKIATKEEARLAIANKASSKLTKASLDAKVAATAGGKKKVAASKPKAKRT